MLEKKELLELRSMVTQKFWDQKPEIDRVIDTFK